MVEPEEKLGTLNHTNEPECDQAKQTEIRSWLVYD